MLSKIKEFLTKWILPVVLVIGLLAGLTVGLVLNSGGDCRDDACKVLCHALNATYSVEGQPITLENGKHTLHMAQNELRVVMTQINYLPTVGFLGIDETPMSAVILTQQAGGGDMAQYIAVAHIDKGKVVGSNALLLAKNVDVDDVTIEDGMIWVTVRPCGETTPTLLQYVWQNGVLAQVG